MKRSLSWSFQGIEESRVWLVGVGTALEHRPVRGSSQDPCQETGLSGPSQRPEGEARTLL